MGLVADTDGEAGRMGITRRTLLVAGAAMVAGIRAPKAAGAASIHGVDFGALPDGDGWPAGWVCTGVANLRVSGGLGVLEAGSDVFPCDPRPLVFAVDSRFRDGSVRALISAAGSLVGVAVRRVGPRDYYAAFYDGSTLSIVRRSGADLATLAQFPLTAVGDLTLELAAAGASPTQLTARLNGIPLSATDASAPLQAAGDAGVLGQARTLFPSSGPAVLPSLGNVHLLPYGVQEGQEFLASPAGQQLIAEIKRESTVRFRKIAITTAEAVQPTPAAVVAATTGLPRTAGARLHVASDLPAEVVIEVADDAKFTFPRRLASGRTAKFDAYAVNAHELIGRTFWRTTLRRAGTTSVGPVRSFPVLPAAGDGTKVRIAIAACAAQFGPLFDDLAALQPDVFVWQGDLNYPDTIGPLAQSMAGYAGIWREFLANPRLAPVLEHSAFVAVRDDHDYAAQDSNASMIARLPWGVEPWDALMGEGHGYRFSAGLADIWVLDQRRFKSDPAAPDGPAKTLLGDRQREWLLHGLRTSLAPFKVICSPCTVFIGGNGRDGNWSNDFKHERDAVLAVIDQEVSGRVIFVTGDTHLTGVYDSGGRFEARPCPLGIPTPNDITLTDPRAADTLRANAGITYADDRCHYAVIEVRGDPDDAVLDLWLRREDGVTPYRRTFAEPFAQPRLRVGVRPAGRQSLRAAVSLDRPGFVRLRATIGGRRVADRVVRIAHAGRRHYVLRVRGPRRGRLTLTARYGRVVRVVRRLLRL